MKLRKFFLFASLAAIAAILYFSRRQLVQFWQTLGHIHGYALILLVIIQLFDYYGNAKFYQSLLDVFGYTVNLKKLYKASLSLNFVNQVFPSGGISGASFLSAVLKPEVPPGKTTVVQLARYVFTYLSFLLVLTLGFLLLFLGGPVNRVVVRVILLLILAIIILGFLILSLLNNRPKVEKLSWGIISWFNTSMGWLLRRRPPVSREKFDKFWAEFYEAYGYLRDRPKQWSGPLSWALAFNTAEVLTVYSVFVAFSQWVNPGVVIAAYTLANIFSLISVFSGGIGFYEGTMVGALVLLGQPLALSLSVVVVYRVANMIIFLPVGFYFYREALK